MDVRSGGGSPVAQFRRCLPPNRVFVIQSQKTLDPDVDWDNEMHPNGEGFRKLVRGPWLDVLRRAGYAV